MGLQYAGRDVLFALRLFSEQHERRERMSKQLTKRPMTAEEVEACLSALAKTHDPEIRQRHATAIEEGYKDEACECGRMMLAHYHGVRCQVDECPFRSKDDRRSMLDMLKDHVKENAKEKL